MLVYIPKHTGTNTCAHARHTILLYIQTCIVASHHPTYTTAAIFHLRPAVRGVTIAAALDDADACLARDDEGVAAAPTAATADEDAVAALLLVTSVSKPAHDAMPTLVPPWLTAKDSQ